MKKSYFLLPFFTVFLSSCSSDESQQASSSGPLVKTMVIDNANPSDEDFNLTFVYSGNKLKSVKDSGVLIEQYVYTGEKLTRINYPADGLYTTIEYNTAGQVVSFDEVDPDFNEVARYEITYSGNNFTRIKYSGEINAILELEYIEVCTVVNGNVTQITRTNSFGSSSESYSYDTKNNPFKNCSNFNVFQMIDADIEGNANNITILDYAFNPYTVLLTYNSENYPILEQTYDGANQLKETVSYTYY
jgi:hypothetical protein